MKTVLALTGGGAKGMFQASALKTLHDKGIGYEAVSGISVGAINGALAAADRIDDLLDFWNEIREEDVHKTGYFRMLWRLVTCRDGLFSNTPLLRLLEKELPEETVMPLRYAAVDIAQEVPETVLFTEDDLSAKSVLASASIPGVWSPVTLPGAEKLDPERVLVDGAVRDSALIEPLLEFTPDRIIVISMGESSFDISLGHPLLNNLVRSVLGARSELKEGDLKVTERINDVVEQARVYNDVRMPGQSPFRYRNGDDEPYRHIDIVRIEPDVDLGSPLDFSRPAMARRRAVGRRAALKALDALSTTPPEHRS